VLTLCPQKLMSFSSRNEESHSKPSLPSGLHWEEFTTGGLILLLSVGIYFGLFLFSCSRLLSSGCSKLRCVAPQPSPGALVCWAVTTGFARPFPQRHWQILSSGRGDNRHLALRQELKPARPGSGQGEPSPALRCVVSSQSRA